MARQASSAYRARAVADHPRLRRILRVPETDAEVVVLDLALGRFAGGHNEDYLDAVLEAIGPAAVWAPDRDGWGRPPGWARRAQDIALAWLGTHPGRGHRRILVTQNPSLWELLTLWAVTWWPGRRAVALFVLRRSGAAGSPFLERLSDLAERSVRSLVRSGKLVPASDSRILLDELERATGVRGTLLTIPRRRVEPQPRTGPPVVSLIGAFRAEKGARHYEAVVDEALARGAEVDVQIGEGWEPDGSAALARTLREKWAGDPRVRVHGSFLPADEYDTIVGRTDVVVAPYDVEVYGTGTSGVLHEAVDAGSVVLTTPIQWAVSEYGDHPRVRFLHTMDRLGEALGEAIELGVAVRDNAVDEMAADEFGDRWREALAAAHARLAAPRPRGER